MRWKFILSEVQHHGIQYESSSVADFWWVRPVRLCVAVTDLNPIIGSRHMSGFRGRSVFPQPRKQWLSWMSVRACSKHDTIVQKIENKDYRDYRWLRWKLWEIWCSRLKVVTLNISPIKLLLMKISFSWRHIIKSTSMHLVLIIRAHTHTTQIFQADLIEKRTWAQRRIQAWQFIAHHSTAPKVTIQMGLCEATCNTLHILCTFYYVIIRRCPHWGSLIIMWHKNSRNSIPRLSLLYIDTMQNVQSANTK